MDNLDFEQFAKEIPILLNDVANPLWLSVSETAKVCGIKSRTVRRAITDKKIKYKIINNRYLVDLRSTVRFLCVTRKLRNKLNTYGIGQYVREWKI